MEDIEIVDLVVELFEPADELVLELVVEYVESVDLVIELFEPGDELVLDTGEADADVGVAEDEEFVLEEIVETVEVEADAVALVLVINLQQSSAFHLKIEYDDRYSFWYHTYQLEKIRNDFVS